jgi:hypothetical protein
MPVDTGRARASWGHWTPGDLRMGIKGASSRDATWKEAMRDLSITQGSNVAYIGALNDGHSQQAPAGFLDVAEREVVEILDQQILDLMGAW